MFDAISDLARDAVTAAGYPGLFAAMVAENLFPPIPSELVLPLAGFEAHDGNLVFVWALLAATAGSLVGALILYAIGRYGGRPVVYRYGRVLRVTDADLDRADAWFDRWGTWVVLGARVIPIARSLVSIPAGMSEMPLGRFVALTTLGSLVWNFVLIGAGYQLGANWEDVTDIVERYSTVMKVAAVAAVVLFVVWVVRRRQRIRAA
ncbi:MAG TPA: DedA family protein [Solirubrobacterales bacterium]|nr:DedA family protein [Solirubrobacterales bacterium]